MKMNSYYKFFSIFLILLSISSFFIGFIYGENSAGAGGFDGDFEHTWRNLQLFLNNDISTALQLTTTSDNNIYMSSRTPMLYIFNKLFNPFVENEFVFIKSIFVNCPNILSAIIKSGSLYGFKSVLIRQPIYMDIEVQQKI